jgi:aminoglycoside phosphotransferase (APT) family kinase protein
MYVVQVSLLSRATAAATSLAGTLDLRVDEAVVLQNSNTLALRLLPCDVFARAAPLGQEVAAFEVRLARELAAATGPVASLDPRVEPRVYEVDGFAVTFWTYYEATPDPARPPEYADALRRLHAAMRNVHIEAPHVMQRVAAAERVVSDRSQSPALDDRDRHLLLSTLHGAGEALQPRAASDQLLHGEPHPGNLITTPAGIVFVDLETCCVGPVEFDVAHAPVEVSTHYPGLDEALLQECRRLVLALVAAWRWDVQDQFPDGLRHGRDILGLLRGVRGG